MNRKYTLDELARRAELKTRRADLLILTLELAARGWPEDYVKIDELDIEIEQITAELASEQYDLIGGVF